MCLMFLCYYFKLYQIYFKFAFTHILFVLCSCCIFIYCYYKILYRAKRHKFKCVFNKSLIILNVLNIYFSQLKSLSGPKDYLMVFSGTHKYTRKINYIIYFKMI